MDDKTCVFPQDQNPDDASEGFEKTAAVPPPAPPDEAPPGPDSPMEQTCVVSDGGATMPPVDETFISTHENPDADPFEKTSVVADTATAIHDSTCVCVSPTDPHGDSTALRDDTMATVKTGPVDMDRTTVTDDASAVQRLGTAVAGDATAAAMDRTAIIDDAAPAQMGGSVPADDATPVETNPPTEHTQDALGQSTDYGGAFAPPPKVALEKTQGLTDAEMKWFWQDGDSKTVAKRFRMNWEAGDLIEGIYEVREVITKGGMGAIYVVYHTTWNRLLVMKSPKPEIMGSPDSVKRYIDEALAWISLGLHPNIASCYYVREVEGMPRIFIEYADSGSLKDWITDKKLTDWKTILDFTIQFCEGLSFAHERIDAHRDVKPANCLISSNSMLKITDFGLVKMGRNIADGLTGKDNRGQAVSASMTGTGQGMGTPPYMPPEQWEDSSKVNREADMYAFAVMLFEMCCGRKPFEVKKTHTMATYRQFVCNAPAPDPADFRPDIPKRLRAFILKNLSKKAEDRDRDFKDARNFFRDMYEDVLLEQYPRPPADTLVQIADSFNNKGVSLFDLGHVDEAIAAFRDARSHDPQHIEAVFNLNAIQCMRHQSDYPELYQLVDNAKRVSHKEQVGERLLGEICAKSGQLEKAETHLKAAGQGIDVLEMLGHAYAGMERYDEAVEHFRSAMENGAGRSAALGLCYALSASGAHVPSAARKAAGITPCEDFTQAYKEHLLPYIFMDTELRGHDEGIKCLSASVTGTRLLSSAHDRTLRLWDLDSHTCLRTIDKVDVECAALSPQGDLAATGSYEGVIEIFDMNSGNSVAQFKGHREWINCISITPDGRHIITGSEDRTIGIHDIRTWEAVRVIENQGQSVKCVKLTPDGKYIVSGDGGGGVRVWNAGTGEAEVELEGHEAPVRDLCIVHKGTMFLSLSEDGVLYVWAPAAGRHVGRLEKIDAHTLCATHNGHFILNGGPDENIRIRNRHTGQCLRILEGHSGPIRAMAMTGDHGLASGSYDSTIRLWNLKHIRRLGALPFTPQLNFPINIGELLQRKKDFRNQFLKAQSALADGDYWTAHECISAARAISGYERRPELLDLLRQFAGRFTPQALSGSWIRHKLVEGGNDTTTMAMDPAGSLCVADRARDIEIWDAVSGAFVGKLRGHEAEIRALALRADRCLSIGGDQTLRLWDTQTFQCLKTMDGVKPSSHALCMSHDLAAAYTADRDGGLARWDLNTGRRTTLSLNHVSSINCVAATSDGRFIITGGQDKTLRIWDARTAHCERVLEGHREQIRCIAVHPDNRFVATGAGGFSQADHDIRIWDIVSGKPVRVLEGHQGWLENVAFTPDGRYVISASRDQTVRVWDIINSQCAAVLDGHGEQVTCMALGGKGRFAVSSGRNEALIVWEFDWHYNLNKPNKYFRALSAR